MTTMKLRTLRDILRLPHGAYSAIGRELDPPVSGQHVAEVFKGKRQSPRVEAAINSYLTALDRQNAAAQRRRTA